MAQRRKTDAGQPALNGSELSALTTLVRRGPMPLADWAAAEGISLQTARRLLLQLSRKSLASRSAQVGDRVIDQVVPTAKGIATVRRSGASHGTV